MSNIVVSNLNFFLADGENERKILDDITLSLDSGKVNVIFGPSGSGKTTLLYALSGMLDSIHSGEIFINGVDIYKLNKYQRDCFRLNNIGIVFQNFNLFDYMSIEENILMPIYANNEKPNIQHKEKMNSLIRLLNIESCVNKSVSALSGGEQQRVAIIRAFINSPKLVICDEPTANLDRENSNIFYNKIRSIAYDENCSVIIVSHDELAKINSDFCIELIDGKVNLTTNY